MHHEILKAALLHGDGVEASELFNEMMRKAVRLGLMEALEAEVAAFCGRKYRPDSNSDYTRAGSEKGSAYINGQKEKIVRPRIRHSKVGEVSLATYQVARSQRNLFDEVVSAMSEGLSSRGIQRHTKNAVSKSESSRMWVKESLKQLEHF